MDGESFDAVVQRASLVSSRRLLLTGVAGSALGALAVTLGFAGAGATHFPCRHVGNRCKRASQCCSGICKRHKCRAHDTDICKAGQDTCASGPISCGDDSAICFCLVTTGKASFCALNNATPSTCTRDEECVTAKGEGAACIVCGGVTNCISRCPAPV
jgi:hypothetical protein